MAEASDQHLLDLIGITNEDLVTEKIKDLNRLLKKKNVPKDEGKKLKELRRRLLNRGYANKSRVKKDDTDQALKAENDIFEEINKMSKDRNSALRHYDHNLDQLNFNLNYELEKEIKEFLGKDGENFDMEKFYEDMTDSEDENDYHNDNESVRGRDDYYKEINFVRKVSQNFSWENDERFTYEINKRLEKIKHLKEEDFENDNDDEEEDVQIQDQESSEDLRWDGLINFADKKFDGMIHCIEGKRIKTEIKEEDEAIACQKDLDLDSFGPVPRAPGPLSLAGFYREQEDREQIRNRLVINGGILKVSNDFNETSTNRLKILEDEKKELTDEEVILQHDLKTKWIKN